MGVARSDRPKVDPLAARQANLPGETSVSAQCMPNRAGARAAEELRGPAIDCDERDAGPVRSGATVIGTVTRERDLELVNPAVAHAVARDQPDPVDAIRAKAPEGVDRIIEVAFSDNADLDADVAANEAVIAAYASRHDRPEIPFWPMLFANLTIRLLGSDDFPAAAKHQAAANLTSEAREGALSIPIGDPLPLEQIAAAHDRVDAGARQRVLVKIPH